MLLRSLSSVFLPVLLSSFIGLGSHRAPDRGHGFLPHRAQMRTAGEVGVSGTPAQGAYRLPVAGGVNVVNGFDTLLSRYQAGHRGVDLGTDSTGLVFAPAPATVRFAGAVAGRGVVVLNHPDGVSTEYEPVSPAVRAGQQVRAGQLIGTVEGTHSGCPGRCLHWGAKRGGLYFDPLALLRPLGPVRLVACHARGWAC